VLLRSVTLSGLAGLSEDRLDLDRVARLSGSLRCRRAFADGLMLAFGALDTLRAAHALGWVGVAAIHDEPNWLLPQPDRLRGLFTTGPSVTFNARLELELDPPQFGQLRERAVSDPDLVDALGDATLRLSLGWALTQDLTLATASINHARLGETNLDLGKPWVLPWLAGLATRMNSHTPSVPDVEVWAAAQRSPDPERRQAFQRAVDTLRAAPFRVGRVRVVDSKDKRWLVVGPDMLPLSRLGPVVQNAIALVESVVLDPSEILVVEEPTALTERPQAVLNWLAKQAEADDSPLEQVVLLHRTGDTSLKPRAHAARTMRRLVPEGS
jgi:hypothetical protein